MGVLKFIRTFSAISKKNCRSYRLSEVIANLFSVPKATFLTMRKQEILNFSYIIF